MNLSYTKKQFSVSSPIKTNTHLIIIIFHAQNTLLNDVFSQFKQIIFVYEEHDKIMNKYYIFVLITLW